ncbi:SusD/RagB family nutrient-binding outer membrane lipoprotein [Winogradskyella maritima]|nr:SusD/RagB family nutrient-binding outer membrane lipoprotein [Winogradskyella maritima]
MQATDLDAYIAQEKVVYSGTTEEKLEKIALQKWISLFYTGFEGWSDWRRTGMPEVTPGPDSANDMRVPVRFQYPNSVKSTNNAIMKRPFPDKEQMTLTLDFGGMLIKPTVQKTIKATIVLCVLWSTCINAQSQAIKELSM